jgi:hypothetical protein
MWPTTSTTVGDRLDRSRPEPGRLLTYLAPNQRPHWRDDHEEREPERSVGRES